MAPAETVAVEACDGSRSISERDPALLTCQRWLVPWRVDGVAKGLVVAESYDAAIAEREQQLAFAREHARFFGSSLDAFYSDPGMPVCSTCDRSKPQGRWGEGQVMGDGPSLRAVAKAQADVDALAEALAAQRRELRDVARLADGSATAKAAKEHAKQLALANQALAEARLALDDAAILRSAKAAEDAGKAARTRTEALTKSRAALVSAVGSMVAKAHGGSYVEEGGTGADAPRLDVQIDGATVTATYRVGAAKSTWFEGTVALDGAISGRSLLAPEDGALTCKNHSTECGYVYIDAMLRFSDRASEGGKTERVAELWFRRAKWVMAKPFVR